MSRRKNSITGFIFLNITAVIVACGLLAFLWLCWEHNNFDNQCEEIKQKAFNTEGRKLGLEVKKTLQYINFQITEGMEQLKISLIRKVDRAYRLASTLYENNHSSITEDELRKIISGSIEALNVPDDINRYTFIIGEEKLKSIYPLQHNSNTPKDTDCPFVKNIKEKGNAFIEYQWPKPGDTKKKMLHKISYIRYFKPYNLFIGSGEYIEDFESELKKELFKWIKTVKTENKEGYLFVITNKGDTIYSPKNEDFSAQFYRAEDHKRILESLKHMYHKAIFSPNGGLIKYLWKNNPGEKLKEKICFVEYFRKWEWAVGAASSLERINQAIDDKKQEAYDDMQKQFLQIAASLLFVLLASLLVNFYAAKKAKSSMTMFLDFFEKSVSRNAQMDIEHINFSEFDRIATEANKVIRQRNEVISELSQFKQMMDGANFGMIITSPLGMIRYANRHFAICHGCRPEELEGTEFSELLPVKNQDDARRILEKMELDGEFTSREIWLKSKEGKPYPVMMTGKTISNNNIPAYHIISIIDISQEKEVEEKLQLTQISLNSASIGVIWIREDGSIFYANDAAIKKLGFRSGEELMNQKINDIDVNSIYSSRKKHWEKLKTSGSITFRTAYRTPLGKLIPMEVNDYYLSYRNNEFEFLFLLDITEKIKAERALKESEFKFQELFNNMLDGVLICEAVMNGENFVIKDINKAGEKISSQRKELISGRMLTSVFPGASRTGILKALQNVYKTGKPEKSSGAFYTDTDTSTCTDNHIYRLPTGEIVCAFEDVSERKKAADALLQSEKKYRELVENANSIILRLRLDGTITFLNEYGQKFFGFSIKELSGKNILGSIVPHYDSNGSDMKQLVKGLCETPWEYALNQNENILKNGNRVWIAWTNKVLNGSDGKPAELLCIGNDITKNRRTENELKEKLSFEKTISQIASRFVNIESGLLEAIEAALGDMTLLCPARSSFIFSFEQSKPICRWNGKSEKPAEKDALGQTEAHAIHESLLLHKYIWLTQQSCQSQPDEIRSTLEQLKADSLLIIPLNAESELRGFIGLENPETTVDNIQNLLGRLKPCAELIAGAIIRRKAETEALLRQQQLIEAEKMVSLGILAAGVAHEINNPANFIMLNTPILYDIWKDTAPILKEFKDSYGDFKLGGINSTEIEKSVPPLFEGIMDGVERIKKIVSGLRNYARKDSQELTEAVKIEKVMNISLTLLSNVIKKATESCKVKIQEHMPPVKGNHQKLEQLLINIIQNACQSDPNKKIVLEINASFQKKTGSVTIEIKDNGKGIPEKFLKHITDPFFTTKQTRGGTGLGLSISAGIVKEHNGKLEFHSKENTGTTVLITLPAYKNNEPERIKNNDTSKRS